MSWVDEAKKLTGETAAEYVKSGQVVGLGSGSTAVHFIRRLGERMTSGELKDIKTVPTSHQAAQDAIAAGIKVTSLDEYPTIDITVDGADQIDPELNLIKGGGAALLREKIIAHATEYYIVIADERKITDVLGSGRSLPIEVLPFAYTPVIRRIEELGGEPVLRSGSGKLGPVVTDNGNFVVDADFGAIRDLKGLDFALKNIPGVLETGLFLGYADLAIVGYEGGVRKIDKSM